MNEIQVEQKAEQKLYGSHLVAVQGRAQLGFRRVKPQASTGSPGKETETCRSSQKRKALEVR